MKLVKKIDKVLASISTIALIVIVISIIINVVLRSTINSPLIWIIEVNGMLVVWLTFLTMGVNTSQNRHFQIEFIKNISSTSFKRFLSIFKDVIVIITLVCMIAFTAVAIKNNSRITTSMTEVRVWIAYYLPGMIGSIHALLYLMAKYILKDKPLDN
jgi:TRAP-type C4-dicarboxylate transport system permease small subunit